MLRLGFQRSRLPDIVVRLCDNFDARAYSYRPKTVGLINVFGRGRFGKRNFTGG